MGFLVGCIVGLGGVLVHGWVVTRQEWVWLDVDRLDARPEFHLHAMADRVDRAQRHRGVTALPLLVAGVLLAPGMVWFTLTHPDSPMSVLFLCGLVTTATPGAGALFYWWTRVNPPVNPFRVHLGATTP